MDWNKAGGLSGVGQFWLGVIMLGITVWPLLSSSGGAPMVNWIPPVIVGLCIVTGGIFHLMAARIARHSNRELLPRMDPDTQQHPAIMLPIANTEDSVQLEVRFDSSDTFPNYFIRIYNPGPNVARNVEVFLDKVNGPMNQYFRGYLPHRLRTHDNENRVDINPDREERFDFATSKHIEKPDWVAIEIKGLKLNSRPNTAGSLTEFLVMEPGEYAHFYVKACCANGPSQTAIFYVWPVNAKYGYRGVMTYKLES